MDALAKEENKKRIVDYLKTHDSADEEEIAAALEMHIIDVVEATLELEKQGVIKEVE
jgi:hypothetical protein